MGNSTNCWAAALALGQFSVKLCQGGCVRGHARASLRTGVPSTSHTLGECVLVSSWLDVFSTERTTSGRRQLDISYGQSDRTIAWASPASRREPEQLRRARPWIARLGQDGEEQGGTDAGHLGGRGRGESGVRCGVPARRGCDCQHPAYVETRTVPSASTSSRSRQFRRWPASRGDSEDTAGRFIVGSP